MAYIDKEKLKNALPHKTPYDRYGNGFNDCLERVHDAIESVPDADVVEVVRCKDCVYANESGRTCHYSVGRTTYPENYCADGIRKGGAE